MRRILLIAAAAAVSGAALARVRRRKRPPANGLLRMVIDATPSMIFVKDWEGRFVLGNRALARTYGTSTAGIVGKTDADFNANKEEVAHFQKDDREVISRRREKIIDEEQVTDTTGETRWFSTVKVPLVEADGSCNKVLGVATDITDRKRAAEALKDADRKKDEFLAMLAHELRNPMAAISAAAALLSHGQVKVESAEAAKKVLRERVHQLARLVDDLLDVSRIVRGKIHLEKQTIDLRTVVTRAVEATERLFKERRQHLETAVPPDELLLEADPVRLEQIVSNLLSNAAKYTDHGGHIVLTAKREGTTTVLQVKDDGIGIPREALSTIFQLFGQVDDARHRAPGGLGIGLSVAKKLTEMHGGAIAAFSAGRGKGSVFTVRLPLAQSIDAAPDNLSIQPRVRQLNILLVEDDRDTAMMTAAELEMEGHQVSVALDAASALTHALSASPDVVLLDIGLPGASGFDVARELRGKGLREALIVAVTGYGNERSYEMSRQAGIDYHLVKPVEYEKLVPLLMHLQDTQHH